MAFLRESVFHCIERLFQNVSDLHRQHRPPDWPKRQCGNNRGKIEVPRERIIRIRDNVQKNLPALSSRTAQLFFCNATSLVVDQHAIAAVHAHECHHQIAVFVA
jgi:hypothetical protein